MTDDPVTGLTTLHFHWGGLLDYTPADDFTVHLVRSTRRGTPGPSLCGIERFGPDTPGFSVGGGLTGPNIVHKACAGCVQAARTDFPRLSIGGFVGARVICDALAEAASQ